MAGKILIVTGEFDSTADLMVVCLRARNIPFERFHPQDIPRDATISLSYGPDRAPVATLRDLSGPVEWSQFSSVWYRRPEPFSLAKTLTPEEQEFAWHECTAVVQGLYRAFDAFWVNHPDKIRVAESKPLQLTLAHKLGFAIPRTLFTNDPEALGRFFEECKGRVVYKSMTQGVLGKSGQQSVYTSRLTAEHVQQADLLKNSPGLFQQEITKACDLRITVIGDRVFPVEIRSQSNPESIVDWRRGEVPRMEHKPHQLPAEIERRCLALNERLGLNYSAIDMILTPDGEYVFLEINPTGQFGWIQDVTGLPLIDTLADLLVGEGA
ncbi:RimK domain protein ATP-grasp [Rhodomicrobium vannielii ATCC 17100]|uniref:RimK domain protein ATP-grasp n=1 Tax=Rhodomicrobium vannielii (strain ATCC 17100 / DSM 162 / LMG 4299 / NCIMB 10020 / ATH 3.1.1) TaxID=648757 RepID=E3I844_RHOVT|nr:RimK domain-containing protein ATP-grasp [Rhodomicrobium vannielii]ADP71970.1 RimK domain protein ATP-grasp [Rhodomicrobium vannielii ATCC 17100]